MSFRGEFKDFVEGFKFGQNVWQENARTKLLEAQTKKASPAPYDPEGPGPFSNPAPKVPESESQPDTPTPKASETKTNTDGDVITGEGGTEGGTLGGSAGGDTMGGGTIVQQAYNYYRGKGLPHAASAGIAGNIGQETGNDWNVIKGTRKGDAGASSYAAQWNGKRLANLRKFSGTPNPSLKNQLDFILEEMKPDSPYADPQAAASFSQLHAAKTPAEAVAIFRKNFERPSANDLASRVKWAGRVSDTGNYETAMLDTAGSGVSGDRLVDSGTVPQDDEGAIPEGDTQRSSDGGDGYTSGSPRAGVDVAAVDLPDINFQPVPLPMLPGMRAATGGAIPEPKRYLAGGFEQGIENIAGSAPSQASQDPTAAAAGGWKTMARSQADLANGTAMTGATRPQWGNMAGQGLWGMRTPPPPAAPGITPAPGGWNAIPGSGVALPGGQVVQQPGLVAAPVAPVAGAPGGTTATTDTGTHPIGTPIVLPAEPAHVTPPAVAPTPTVTPSQTAFDKLTKKPKTVAPVAPTGPVEYQTQGTLPQTGRMMPQEYNQAVQQYAVYYGIPVGEAAKLFKPYPQRDTSNAKGTGGGQRREIVQIPGPPPKYVLDAYGKPKPAAKPVTPTKKKTAPVKKKAGTTSQQQFDTLTKFDGGAIPEPGETGYFARGGSVPGGSSFEEETRIAERGLNERQRESGLSGRDIAARRRNIAGRNVSSTAYDPTKDPTLFQPRKTKTRTGGGGGGSGDKTSSTGPSGGMTTEEKRAEERDRTLEPPAVTTGGGMTTEERRAEERDRTLAPPATAIPEDPRLNIPLPDNTAPAAPAIPEDAPTPDPMRATPPPEEQPPAAPAPEITGGGVDRAAEAERRRLAAEQAELERRRSSGVVAEERKRQLREKFPNAKFPADPASSFTPDTNMVRPAPQPQPQPNVGFGDVGNTQFSAARKRIAAGENAKDVGEELIQSGQPVDLWPTDLQNAYYGFAPPPVIDNKSGGALRPAVVKPSGFYAEGGAIPDEEEQSDRAGYTTSGPGPQQRNAGGYRTSATGGGAPAAAPAEEEPVQDLAPTPEARSSIARALDGGLKFLQQTFTGRDGAIATPDDGAVRDQGAKRMASGEGAATQEEVNQIDDQVDPQRKLDEGDRQMTRLAKVVDWYQQQGRTKEAQSAAASLMQYGATRFSQLGSVAAAAYADYQKSGDINDLNEAVKYLEHAYQFIPDGSTFDITIDPKTHQLQAMKTDADGNETPYNIQASELPGLIRQVQSKSPYWQQITRMADPEGYKSDLIEKRQEAAAVRTDERAAHREKKQDERTAEREALTDKRAAQRDEEWYRRQAATEDRQQRQSDRVYARDHPDIWPTLNPLVATYRAAKKAYDDADDPDNVELRSALDKAGSAIWDAMPPNDRRNPELLQQLGIYPDDWDYVGNNAGATGGPATPAGGATPADPSTAGAPTPAQPAVGAGASEGRTATGPNGEKMVVKNGQWVPA